MGDWIKENKFEAGLLLVVLLAVIAAFMIGGSQSEDYRTHKDFYDRAASTLNSLESKQPYPTRDGAEEYQEEVEDYQGVIEGLQEKLLAYRPATFERMAPADFTEKLNAKREALAQRYGAEGIKFPDEWHLGFERYTATPPSDAATDFLSYQLDAHDWLFGALADADPSELVNVVRDELPVEAGQSMDGDADKRPKTSVPAKPFYVLPVELTFKGPEPAVRDFLASLAGNDQHFFVIRTMRIQNEKRDKPPQKDDVDFQKKAPAGDTPFDPSFDLIVPDEEGAPEGGTPTPEETPAEPLFPTEPEPGEEPPPAPAPGAAEEGERILGQILGAEEVYVFLQLDLLLFKVKEDSGIEPPKETAANKDS